jgi:hypothetical protein
MYQVKRNIDCNQFPDTTHGAYIKVLKNSRINYRAIISYIALNLNSVNSILIAELLVSDGR